MDVYWYWPYVRREELALATGLLRAGDHLAVHSTPRPTDPVVSPHPDCEILPPLPGVDERTAEGSLRWAASRGTTYLARARARAAEVRGGHHDLAHVVYLNPFVDWVALRRLARQVPLVSSVHDVTPHQRRMPEALERRVLARQYAHAGTIVVHHGWVRDRLIAEFAIDPNRVHVVPAQVIPAPPVEAGPTDGPPEVLFFGTFRRNKGIDVLLEAVRRLPSALELRVVLAGRGFADVERAVREAAMRDPRIVPEIGYATAQRKAELYARATLNVLPYTAFESQSAVLQDAYAHGVPLVVTSVGALGDTVRDEGTGIVVPPADADALAEAITTLVSDPTAHARAADATRRVAEARHPARIGRAHV